MLASSVSAISYDDGDILSDSGSLEMSVVDDSDLSASDSIYVDDVGFDNAAINDFPESDSSLATSDLDSAVLSDSQELVQILQKILQTLPSLLLKQKPL